MPHKRPPFTPQEVAMHAAQGSPQYRPSRSAAATDPLDAIALNGDCVRDSAGDDIGRIEGVMLDGRRERIMYAILSLAGNRKLFAVPWNVLRLNPDEACVILDIPRVDLEDAPTFDRDSWPSITDQAWRQEIDGYFRARRRRR
jgi:hypothetical protein